VCEREREQEGESERVCFHMFMFVCVCVCVCMCLVCIRVLHDYQGLSALLLCVYVKETERKDVCV